MRIFRCDVCKRDVELAQLKGGALTIKLGESLLLNLPETDRCVKCYDAIVTTIRTIIASVDDTQHGKIPGAQVDTNPDLDLTPLLDDPTWVEGAP